MSKELKPIKSVDGDISLTRFYGLSGAMLQLTKWNKDTNRHEYIQLSQANIRALQRRFKNGKWKSEAGE